MEDLTDTASRGDAAKLIAQIEHDRGLDLTQYRLSYVERRIGTRLRALNLVTYRQYAAYLTEHPEEYPHLLDSMTVNVTEFFRDPPVWRIIEKDVVAPLLAAKAALGQRTIRVWSAGCATGEEAYSIAMCFLSAMGAEADSYVFSVLATDLDPLALKTAEAAEYDVAKLENIPVHDRVRYLTIEGKRFKINPEVREKVRFRKLNLFADEPPRAVDLVLCRNVFIYFSREQQERATMVFHGTMMRGGYLVLGRTEKMAASAAVGFTPVSTKERVYRKA
jgi:chemotaxis protein methyltransferase CheR